ADVKYSLDRFRSVSPRSADLASVNAVEVVDDYTVRVTLGEPDVTFLAMLANPYTVAIIPEGSAPAEEGATIQEPIGTGPFSFGRWDEGQSLTLHRFADYSPIDLPPSGLSGHKEALVDEVIFRVIPDSQATVAALETGE